MFIALAQAAWAFVCRRVDWAVTTGELAYIRFRRRVPRETSRPTYKELMMKRDGFEEVRQRIDWALSGDEVQPTDVEFDDATGDVLVSGTFGGVRRTYRLTITEEPVDVPRETSGES